MKIDRSREDLVFSAVTLGIIEVDAQGRCWRNSPRRRAERRCNGGYLQLSFTRNGVRATAMAHRVVYRALVGEIAAGLTINHRDGIKDRNLPENLEPATYSEQIKHAKEVLGRKYRDVRGEGNSMAKLKTLDVLAIRRRRSLGEKLTDIARDFGIVFQTVSQISRGDRWRSPTQQEAA